MKVVCTIAIWFDGSDQTITMSASADLIEEALNFAFCQDEKTASENMGIVYQCSGMHVTKKKITSIFYDCKDASTAVKELRALDYVNVDVFFNLIGSAKPVS